MLPVSSLVLTRIERSPDFSPENPPAPLPSLGPLGGVLLSLGPSARQQQTRMKRQCLKACLPVALGSVQGYSGEKWAPLANLDRRSAGRLNWCPCGLNVAVFVFILVMLMDHPLAPCPVGRVLPPPWLSKRGARPTVRHTPSSGSAGPVVWSVGCCGVLLRRLLSDGRVHTRHTVTAPVLAVWVFVTGD